MTRALFGGSFDPVHNGHVNLVRQVYNALAPEEIIVIPTGISPFKKDSPYRPASSGDRLEMCRLAFEGVPRVTVSGWETSRNCVSYTIDTVRHFREEYPGDRLVLLIGGDMLLSFDRWRSWQEIFSICTLCAVSREIGSHAELEKKAAELERYGEVMLLQAEPLEISSTKIRENFSEYSCYVPENVVKYILDNGLYKA